jgi:hypothetical protein
LPCTGRNHPHLAIPPAPPAEPWASFAQSQQLRNATGILAVGLDGHGLEGVAHMPCLQEFHRQARIAHRGIKPLRQRPGLQPHPRQLKTKPMQPADQGFRLACHLRLAQDPSGAIHDAHTALFQ